MRKKIIFIILTLNILSLTSLYSSLHQAGEFLDKDIFYKQLLWIFLSWGAIFLFSSINYQIYYHLSLPLYFLNILFLILLYFFGHKTMGAQRWINIMGINFQPSEFSKLTTILYLGRFFMKENTALGGDKKSFFKNFLPAFFMVLVNVFLIYLQPDLGTAIFIFLLFLTIGLFSPLKKIYFIFIIVLGILSSPFLYLHLKPYQKKRLEVFLNPNVDPLGSGYTIIQSKIAIGSGKFLGKGFLSGTQNQFNFLPERHTDFIFTVIAEEEGFLGASLLLFLYGSIIYFILKTIKTALNPFARILSLSISAYIFLHVFINIGMTIGILPVVGLPLIFISYGGSNLIISASLVGIFFNIVKSEKIPFSGKKR